MKKEELLKIIAKARTINPFENLRELMGDKYHEKDEKLGQMLYDILDEAERLAKSYHIDMAEQQLLGWKEGKQGYGVDHIVVSSGLTLDEWEVIKTVHEPVYLSETDIEMIETELRQGSKIELLSDDQYHNSENQNRDNPILGYKSVSQ